jgi:hypothetical protein
MHDAHVQAWLDWLFEQSWDESFDSLGRPLQEDS